MTLVQILADETSIHMSCDFRLTDFFTKKIVQHDAHKLVQPSLFMPTIMGLTGVATLEGMPAGQWMVRVIDELDWEAPFTEVLAFLEARLTAALQPINDSYFRRTTIVVAAMVGSQANLALVSNFERFQQNKIERASHAWPKAVASTTRPKRPRYFATGAASAVPQAERTRLEQLLRSGADAGRIQVALSEVNRKASHADKSISAGCHTASCDATLRGSSQGFLTDEQAGDFIPPELESAIRQLRLQLNLDQDTPGAPTPLRARNIASFRLGSTPEYFREQLKLRPTDPELLANYGSYLQNTKHDSRAAIEQYQKAVQADSTYMPALANLAKSVWLADNDVGQAKKLYERVLESAQSTIPGWILTDLGAFYELALHLPDQADSYHQAAVKQSPYDYAAKALYADFLHRNDRDLERAKALLDEALEKGSRVPVILRVAGEWALAAGDNSTAYGYFASAHSLDPRDASALHKAGQLAIKMGQPYLAIQHYRRLIGHPQADWSDYMNYGVALLMEGKLNGALNHLTKAQEMAPEEPLAQANLAGALFASRRDLQAIKLMRQIMERPLSSEIELELLAMLQVADPSDEQRGALERLLQSGSRTTGEVIRAMSRDRSKEQRALGIALAAQIEQGIEDT